MDRSKDGAGGHAGGIIIYLTNWTERYLVFLVKCTQAEAVHNRSTGAERATVRGTNREGRGRFVMCSVNVCDPCALYCLVLFDVFFLLVTVYFVYFIMSYLMVYTGGGGAQQGYGGGGGNGARDKAERAMAVYGKDTVGNKRSWEAAMTAAGACGW